MRKPSNRQIPEELLDTTGLEVISTYGSLRGAQHAVEVLAGAGYDVRQLAIVGQGLTTVERVTGKLTYGKVALSGAFSGLYFGVGISLVATLAGLLERTNSLNTLLACMVIGIGIGMLLAVANHALNGRRRSYTGFGGITASRYDLLGARSGITKARQLLAEHAIAEH